jgi:hypothetical protein
VVGRVLLGAGAAVAVVLLPFLVSNPGAITAPFSAWANSGAGLGSPWIIPELLGRPLPNGAVTALAVVGVVAAVLAGALFALGTDRRPSVAEVSLVLVGLALVTGKSFPVQASLWLLPLVALCGVRWRDHLVWVGAEAMHFAMVWLYIGGMSKADRGLPGPWYAVFLVLRVAAVLYLVWRVWHDAAGRPPAAEPADIVVEQIPSERVPAEPQATAPAEAESTSVAGPAVAEVDEDELAGAFAGARDRLIVRIG